MFAILNLQHSCFVCRRSQVATPSSSPGNASESPKPLPTKSFPLDVQNRPVIQQQTSLAHETVSLLTHLTLCSRATTKVVFFCYPVRSPVATFVVFSRAVL
jgi:hypothetical protein